MLIAVSVFESTSDEFSDREVADIYLAGLGLKILKFPMTGFGEISVPILRLTQIYKETRIKHMNGLIYRSIYGVTDEHFLLRNTSACW